MFQYTIEIGKTSQQKCIKKQELSHTLSRPETNLMGIYVLLLVL